MLVFFAGPRADEVLENLKRAREDIGQARREPRQVDFGKEGGFDSDGELRGNGDLGRVPGIGIEVASPLPGYEAVIAPVDPGCTLHVLVVEFFELIFQAL